MPASPPCGRADITCGDTPAVLPTVLEITFWLSALGVLTPYAIYPALMILVSRAARPRGGAAENDALPRVTMIVSAFDEEAVIAQKIENALAIDYPDERFELIVISDESTDRTDEIVSAYADRGVRLCRQAPRGGKSRGLTTFVPSASGEILVFSDANSMYRPDAVRKLVRHFADARVGYVVGYQRYTEDDAGEVSFAERLYWSIEARIKVGETRLGSVVGGDGAIYATRASLFEPLRDDDLSDFVNPLQIVAKGYRGVFEPEAVCLEDVASSYEGEFRRKIRIVNRALRAVLRVPAALNPARVGVFALQLFAHKLLRWFSAYLLAAALLCNVGLVLLGAGPFYVLTLLAQVLVYVLAALKPVPVIGALRVVYIPYYFCLATWASFLATVGVLTGRKFVPWQPERS